MLNYIDLHVGKKVRLLREGMGMSSDALARVLGCEPQEIEKFERGAKRISVQRLFEIARVLDVELQEFFADIPRKDADPSDRSAARSAERRHLRVVR